MRTRLLAGAVALVLAIGGLLVPASPASANCGHDLHRDEYNAGGIFWRDGTNIRTGPHTFCTIIGQSQRGDGIDVHCAILFDQRDSAWLFVRNLQTGRQGWSHWQALRIPETVRVPACQSTDIIIIPPTV